MTIIFENINTGKEIEIEDVAYFSTDAECLGAKGYSIHYKDGTFNLFAYDSWRLVKVIWRKENLEKQDIFKTLADLECETFYKHTDAENKIIRQALEAYAELTGCHN